MASWQIPLLVASLLFACVLLFRARPLLRRSGRSIPPSLRDVILQVERAETAEARARALCDAGDVASLHVGRRAQAVGFYLRALRADPTSTEMVARVASTLASRPKALEAILLRRLAANDWTDEQLPAVLEALKGLAGLYSRRRRSALRGRVFARIHAFLEGRKLPDA